LMGYPLDVDEDNHEHTHEIVRGRSDTQNKD